MSSKKLVLPPLPFGHNRSQVDLDLYQMQSRVNAITNWVSDYDTLGKAETFQHRTSVYGSDGVRMIAVASSPTVMKVKDPDYTIAIPLSGDLESWFGKHHLVADVGKQGIFNTKGFRHSEGGIKSALLVSVSEQRLMNTAKIMLGERYEDLMQLEKSRLVETQIQQIDFRMVLGQLCNLIDQFQGNHALLRSFNVDENITRLFVMMLAPEQFIKSNDQKHSSISRKVVEHLCDFIIANLDNPLSLTTLESISGLSSRTIQKEFQKHFSCTPMQWIKQQRLSRAKELLSNATMSDTVGVIAAQCGYANFSEFSRQYRETFGVLPNETLKKSRNL